MPLQEEVLTHSLKVFLLASITLIFAACGGGSGGGGADQQTVQLKFKADVSGKSIYFTVTQSDGAVIPAGYVIRYTFDYDGDSVGYNPESGASYYPNSYSFTSTSSTVTITLLYGGGAYEEYTLKPKTECGNEGTFDLESSTGVVSGTAKGNYYIDGDGEVCLGGSLPVAESEPNNSGGTADSVRLNQMVLGSVNYSDALGSGPDQNDYYSYTFAYDPYANIHLRKVTLAWKGEPDALDLYVSPSDDYQPSSYINYREQMSSGEYSVKYFYMYELNGTTIPFTVIGKETGGELNYSLVVTEEYGFRNNNFAKRMFAGEWEFTERIGSNTCGFTNGIDRPSFDVDIYQIGYTFLMNSEMFSDLLIGNFALEKFFTTNYEDAFYQYNFDGGVVTITNFTRFNANVSLNGQRDLFGIYDWVYTKGITDCEGNSWLLGSPKQLVSETFLDGKITTTDSTAPVVTCCTIFPPYPDPFEEQFQHSQVGEWMLLEHTLDHSGLQLTWEVTIDDGTPQTKVTPRDLTIVKMYSQGADWKLTVKNTSTFEETVISGRIEADKPRNQIEAFDIKEPSCVENTPESFCNAIGQVDTLEMWDEVINRPFNSSTFDTVSASCSLLGYSAERSFTLPGFAVGVDPTGICTYRE